uniref:C2H2-type domain-containing protein n=1 Tax=Glossina austeni TaxID=7395 RepID=A0A1A9VG69_GLOAU
MHSGVNINTCSISKPEITFTSHQAQNKEENSRLRDLVTEIVTSQQERVVTFLSSQLSLQIQKNIADAIKNIRAQGNQTQSGNRMEYSNPPSICGSLREQNLENILANPCDPSPPTFSRNNDLTVRPDKNSCTDIDVKELSRERKQKDNKGFDGFYVSILEQVHQLNETPESHLVEILRTNLLQEIQHEMLNEVVYSASLLKEVLPVLTDELRKAKNADALANPDIKSQEEPVAIICTDDSSPMSTFDDEVCKGKIVCRIDGNSFIINAENETNPTLNDSSASVAAQPVTSTTASALTTKTSLSSCFTITKTWTTTATTKKSTSPQIFNAIYREQNQQQQQRTETEVNVNPKIRTFRVIFANDAKLQQRNEKTTTTATHFKIQKPILMCFICKLSFGITKSFSLHASIEHGLSLQELEKHLLLQREYSSAIIQRNMDEKPQISFLEPMDTAASSLLHIESQPTTHASRQMTVIDREGDTALEVKTFTDILSNDEGDDDESDNVNNKTTNTFASVNQFSDPAKISLSTAPAAMISTTVDTSQSHSDKKSSTQLPDHRQHLKYFYDDSTTDVCSILTNSNILTLGPSNLEKLKSTNTNTNTTTTIDVTKNNTGESPLNRFIIAAACTKSSLTVKRAPEKPMGSSLAVHNLPTPDSLIQRLQKISTENEGRILSSPVQADGSDMPTDDDVDKPDALTAHLSQLSIPHSFSTPLLSLKSSVVSMSTPESVHFNSLEASLPTLSSEKNNNKAKFLNEFLQHQLNTMYLQQQSLPRLINKFSDTSIATFNTTSPPAPSLAANACPHHADCKGIDCKSCELLEIQQHFKQSAQVMPQLSPSAPCIVTAAAAAAAGLGLLSAANTISPPSNVIANSSVLTGALNPSNMIHINQVKGTHYNPR